MPDDLLQQATQQAPLVGIGGALTFALSLLTHSKIFAKPQDIDMAKMEIKNNISELKVDIAKTYVTKEDIEPIRDDIRYIKDRIDRVVESK